MRIRNRLVALSVAALIAVGGVGSISGATASASKPINVKIGNFFGD